MSWVWPLGKGAPVGDGGEAIAGKVKSLRKGLRDKRKRPVYLVLL